MEEPSADSATGTASEQDILAVTDRRTGQQYELPITDDTIQAMDLRGIKVNEGDFGMMPFDPGLSNTAVCRSSVCFIDGEQGILEYSGYRIEELAEHCSYMEVCYLVLNRELPNAEQLAEFEAEVRADMVMPESVMRLQNAMDPDLHPMSMLQTSLAALAGEYPEAAEVLEPEVRRQHTMRLIAMTPVIAALGFRFRTGAGPIDIRPELSYSENFLHMMLTPTGEEPNVAPAMVKAMDALLVLHADHEQNCSTNAVRAVGSSQVNPYSAVTAGAAALHGPLHGGANQKVLEMLESIEDLADVPAFLESCQSGDKRLMGFGHRVYKNYDPRAKVIGKLAGDVVDVAGPNRMLEIAQALEKTAIEDDYFTKRKLFPNVDFYSGMIYSAMGFCPRSFTVFFAVGRMVGWLAHWEEMMADVNNRIVRPRQIYTGYPRRDFVPMDQR
ncbi:MAG: citrate (Si)-synthase [Planctomycetes bacterium]|nr:citrate (Si)-synthase [Planctomycetota bacterium]MCP4772486.1 citrate (Si)-synthase [Planctomycetota bacterium]MCP4860121.1 citrate (Si)-synthase [Planctomycetota bacterium]